MPAARPNEGAKSTHSSRRLQAILALWFQQRYGVSTSELGLLFFATNLLPALSRAFAPALGARQGLLKAMLLPHAVPSLASLGG